MISKLAYVHPDAKIGGNVTIEPFAYVAGDVVIGDDCWIGPGAVINDGARIGTALAGVELAVRRSIQLLATVCDSHLSVVIHSG